MSDWRTFLLGLGYDLGDVVKGVRTKLDQDKHNELEEWSNKLTSGNISAATRIMIVLGMDRMVELWEGKVPSVTVVNRGREKWIKEQGAKQRLRRGVHELQQHYTKEYEDSLKKYAEEEGLEWPPPESDYKQIDPTVKRVLEKLDTVLCEKETATLRDVYNGLSGMGASDARDAVLELENMGVVNISGSRQAYGTMQISWARMTSD